MTNDSADFITSLYGVAKWTFLFFFGTPFVLWTKPYSAYCSLGTAGICYPTAGFSALLSVLFIPYLVNRVANHRAWAEGAITDRPSYVVTALVAAFYLGMPAIYDGFAEMSRRARDEEINRMYERRQRRGELSQNYETATPSPQIGRDDRSYVR